MRCAHSAAHAEVSLPDFPTCFGHIDLVHNDLSDIADGVIKMMTPVVLAGDGSPAQFCLRRCGPPGQVPSPCWWVGLTQRMSCPGPISFTGSRRLRWRVNISDDW